MPQQDSLGTAAMEAPKPEATRHTAVHGPAPAADSLHAAPAMAADSAVVCAPPPESFSASSGEPAVPVASDLDSIAAALMAGHYREGDSLWAGEPGARVDGLPGTTPQYSAGADSYAVAALLLLALLSMAAVSSSGHYLLGIAKAMARPRRSGQAQGETSAERRTLYYFGLQAALLCSVLYYYTAVEVYGYPLMAGPYEVMGLSAAAFAGYFILKPIAYAAVSWVFCPNADTAGWLRTYGFIVAAEGALLFPVVAAAAFFHIGAVQVAALSVAILIVRMFFTAQGLYRAFFKGGRGALQLILYLCTLEIAPIAALAGMLSAAAAWLEANPQ